MGVYTTHRPCIYNQLKQCTCIFKCIPNKTKQFAKGPNSGKSKCTIHMKCFGSIRYLLNEHKTLTKNFNQGLNSGNYNEKSPNTKKSMN